MRVFFILWGHVSNHAQIWAFVTSISHMGEMRDSDWSRQILLRSDWLLPIGAIMTTIVSGKNRLYLMQEGNTVNKSTNFTGRVK